MGTLLATGTSIRTESVCISVQYWLVVFEEPNAAFLGDGEIGASSVSVYDDHQDIRRRSRDVFRSLDYLTLSGRAEPVSPALVTSVVAPADCEFLMKSLLVTYADADAALAARPVIHVLPEIIIYRRPGRWLRVRGADELRFPAREREVAEHLADVAHSHEQSIAAIRIAIGRELPIRSLEECYGLVGQESFRPGVQHIGKNTYLVTTGVESHFIVDREAPKACRFHGAAAAAAEGMNLDFVVQSTSSIHVTHAVNDTRFYCAHRTIREFKQAAMMENNRDRFQPRSIAEDGPFCKLWPFERLLCCQTCVFGNVCSASIKNFMPCDF